MTVLDMLKAPWAIEPEILTEMCAIYMRHRSGETIDIKAIEAATGRTMNNTPKPYEVQDGVALIPIEGVLAKRMSFFTQICGGMSYTSMQRDLAQALADPEATSIILTIDSPGGTVDGIEAAGNAIYEARSQKPIAAYVDGKATSAAYWLGSAASQMYIGSDADVVGSIGVIMTHIDTSAAETLRGVKYTDLTAGRYKATGTSHKPLSGQDFGIMQDQLDQLYGNFVETIARNRGVDAQAVVDKMADGRVFLGQKAISAGLVDGKMTLPQLMQMMKKHKSFSVAMSGGGSSFKSSASSGGAQSQSQTKGNTVMAEVELTKAAYEAALAQAKQSGVDAGIAQGRTEGATAERERIQAVEKVALPGHEKLIASLKFDGKTSGPEAAVQVLAAENTMRGEELAKMRMDAVKPVPPSQGSEAADAEAANAKTEPTQIDSVAVAEQARTLVAKSKTEGKLLSFAQAVAQITAKK